MISIHNKNVLITGGSRGIGKACVELFLKAGANVAFTFQSAKNEADQVIADYTGSLKLKHYKLNLANTNEIEKVIGIILNDFRNIDVLVNNAGIWKEAAIDQMTIDEWNEMLNINLTSTYLITKLLVPGMKKNKFGRIINIASTAGQRGEAFHSHYAASKGGMISLTKSLASELGQHNITVNCVAPGWVFTDMTTDSLADEKIFQKVLGDIPLNKVAQPEEIAGPVVFLASQLASHITGEILNVNGGSVLCG
ncbi:MAG: 3-oxoacyl-ACP reductase FabG [Ignavibacteriaceae bacterium]|jgi:3-oxoacyl-[acyl-carrier protein] reductase|nr:3-oxoacyl-ACP reductase FabG [Ignavibacteriaceae bacterium]